MTLTVGGREEIDEVRSGGYHISQGDFRVHFGMGQATKADLTIRWPDGPEATWRPSQAWTPISGSWFAKAAVLSSAIPSRTTGLDEVSR